MFHNGSAFSELVVIENNNLMYRLRSPREIMYSTNLSLLIFIWSLRTIYCSSRFYKFTVTDSVLLTFKTLLPNVDAPFITKKNNRPVGKVNYETQCHDRSWHRQTNLEFHTLHQIGLMIRITHSGVYNTLRCLKEIMHTVRLVSPWDMWW